ncbi:MAG: diacylglycerol/lipid kinase family protein [Microthrixaceae bacterium]
MEVIPAVSHDGRAELAAPEVPGVSARRQAVAISALLLVPIGGLLVLWGVLHGLPELLFAAAAAALAGWAGWIGLGHRSLARVVWMVLAVLFAGLTTMLVLVSGRYVLWVVGGTLAAGVGASAAGAALLHAPRADGGRRRLSRRVPQRPVLFANPRSGGGTVERVGLVEEARARGVRVVELAAGIDLLEEARRAVAEGADCLGAAGGDGTLALVAQVAIESDLPFVCIPAGTRNHFALDLGLDRHKPVGALDAFGEAYSTHIDVAEVNDRLFLNNVSIGVYGEVVADEQYRENKIGTALGKLPSLIGPDAPPLDLRFTDGEGTRHDSAIVLHVSNNEYEITPRPGFGSRPTLKDGRLGVVAVFRGGALDPVRIVRWSAPTFEVSSGGPVAAGLDGEAVDLEVPVRFRIRPRALKVRLPVHAVGASPAARRPRLTRRTVDRLLSLAMGRVPA